MNPTQKQFSLNRGASRKQIPISRFSDAGNEVFAGLAGWIPTAMTLGGMHVSAVEINEEDAP